MIQALLELDCMPTGMELFPASDETKWSLIARVIDDCDYYIVIIGGRYGSVDNAGVSYTEREYDYAVKAGLPVLAFLHAEPGNIPSGKSELAPEARAKLDAFRAKAESRMCKHWKSPEELGGVVSRSLVQMMKLQPGEGWIRAKFASNAEELQRLRSKIDELTSTLEAVRTAPPAEARNLAQGKEQFTVNYSDANGSGTLSLEWDEIFAALGPAMFDEASEMQLRGLLKNLVITRIRYLGSEHRLNISLQDFHTIKVQFRALGLIQVSTKKRSLRDSGSYWTLTPYGEHYATILRAILKAGSSQPFEGSQASPAKPAISVNQ